MANARDEQERREPEPVSIGARLVAFRRLDTLSLRWRFRLLVIAFGLPFIAYIVWSATVQAGIERRHHDDQTLAMARFDADRLDDYVQQVDRVLATAAFAIADVSNDRKRLNGLLQDLRSSAPASVNNIAVWSLDGGNIASLDSAVVRLGFTVSDRTFFKRALAERKFIVDAPSISRSTGTAVAQFARPVFDTENRIIAIVSMSTRLKDLAGELDDSDRLPENGLVTIVDRSGTVIGRSSEALEWIGKKAPWADDVADAFSRHSGLEKLESSDHRVFLGAFSAASLVPWVVYVGVPRELAVAPVTDRLAKNLVIGAAILALSMLLAGRIAVWTQRPIQQLAEDTDKLALGDFAHRSTVRAGGEVMTLADNFNRMAESLESRAREIAARREVERRLMVITDNLPVLIAYVDLDGHYQFVSKAFERWLGLPLSQIVGKRFRDLLPPESVDSILEEFERAKSGEQRRFEMKLPMPGEQHRWLDTLFIPDIDPSTGLVRGVYGMSNNATHQKALEEKLVRLATYDSLTGIPNRHHFNERLQRTLAELRVDEHAALLFLDVDHFKEVNDVYGHVGGDALLKEFARRLTTVVRPTDVVARLAGDEFVLLFERLNDASEAHFIARKIVAEAARPVVFGTQMIHATCSVGVVALNRLWSPMEAMQRADALLYESKKAGRNTFRAAG